jgi:deoxycytidylate deaminase
MCAKAIVNSGISEVYYLTDYREEGGLVILRDAGLLVDKTIL